MRDVVTDAAIRNAMVVHAAFGGSTNLLLHIPAVAHAAGRARPTIDEWLDVNRRVPRLVDSLPNGPHPTVRVFLAGGVPEVMLHLRELGLLDLSVLTASGEPLGDMLAWWEASPRRQRVRELLRERDGIDPGRRDHAAAGGAGQGADQHRVLHPRQPRARGRDREEHGDRSEARSAPTASIATPARRASSPRSARRSRRSRASRPIGCVAGTVMVLIGRGPIGAGMEETYQVTSALKHLDIGKTITLITDARFSGVSTGACIGHVGPEALAGGPIGRLVDGDIVRVVIDTRTLDGSIDLMDGDAPADAALATRSMRPDLAPDPALPDATRIWAAMQQVSGGTWGGCVYDARRDRREAAVPESAQNARPEAPAGGPEGPPATKTAALRLGEL